MVVRPKGSESKKIPLFDEFEPGEQPKERIQSWCDVKGVLKSVPRWNEVEPGQ